MFKSLLIALFLITFSSISKAQTAVNWSFSVDAVEIEKDTYSVIFHANVNDGWHLYSQHLPSPDAGPLPTVFGFDENENVQLIGTVEEETDKIHIVMDEAFGVQVSYFSENVVFTQKVKLNSNHKTTISGYISYMVCNNEMCVPKDLDFNLPIGK